MRTGLCCCISLILLGGCYPASTSTVSTSKRSKPIAKPEFIAPQSTYLFEQPVRLKAAGEFIVVDEPGYAFPCVADVDGDGKDDLVVGQFSGGRMRFFRNVSGAYEPPQLAAAEWILSGEEPAEVPGVW